MRMLFGILVVANLLVLGYSQYMPKSNEMPESAKTVLVNETTFKNTTNTLPPEIGKK